MGVLTFDGLNLSDGVNYFPLLGLDPGTDDLTFDEYRGYTGNVTIANVSSAHVAQVTLPLDCRATSEAAMLALVAAVNAKVAACTVAAPKTLVIGGSSYSILPSPQQVPVIDGLYVVNIARMTWVLNRLP